MPQYRNERREYLPSNGDEVVVHGRFMGKLVVEDVDVERKTANLRNLRDNTLTEGVPWSTILPLKQLRGLRSVIEGISKEE